MARDPIILAMANPTPEILPEDALAVRPDAIIGTGRSDYPNQVNNVLCFPFIFRGALDVGATTINEEMKLAAVRAIAELAHAEIPEVVAQAYGAVGLRFGARLPDPEALRSAPDRGGGAGGGAGRDGQRRRDAADRRHAGLPPAPVAVRLPVGQQRCSRCSPRPSARPSAWSMPKAKTSACCAPRRWWSTKAWRGRCCSGRPEVIAAAHRASSACGWRSGEDCESVNLLDPAVYGDAADDYYQLKRRDGVSRAVARAEMRSRGTLLGGDAGAPGHGRRDAVRHLRQLRRPPAPRARRDRPARRHADAGRDADADAARAPALHLRHARQPRPDRRAGGRDRAAGGRRGAPLRRRRRSVALLSHSSFGGSDAPSAREDARGAGADQGARPAAGGRRRDARRRGAVEADPRPRVPRLGPERPRPTCW